MLNCCFVVLLFCYFVVGITPTIILSDTLKFAVLKWGDRA